MVNYILRMGCYKKLYYLVILELMVCFAMDRVLHKNIFLCIGIIFNIALIIGIYIYYNNYLIIGLTLLSSFTLTYLIENMKFPSACRYIQDIFILMMAAKIILYFINRKSKLRTIYYFMFIFLASCCISYIINPTGIIEYIKALYSNYLRYFIISIFIAVIFLPQNKILKFIRILWYVLLFQIPIIIFQYFWGLKHWVAEKPGDLMQDYLCGILGGRGTTELGFLAIIGLTALFVLYLNNKVKLHYFIIVSILLITIIMLAEVKIVFVLLPIMFFIVLVQKINFKSIATFSLIVVALVIGTMELGKIYPGFNNFFSISTMESYSDSTYAASGVGRSNSFKIAKNAISSNYLSEIVGYGAGNADKISKGVKFSAFNVSQYIVECGCLGTACIYGIFIYMIYVSIYLTKYGRSSFEKILGQVGVISMLIIIISTFNNMSMMKINFAIFAWMLMGLIYKYYYLCREKVNE